MVRIRYVLENEGRLVSKPIVSQSGTFKVIIESDSTGVGTFSFDVRREDSPGLWTVCSSGKSRNLTVAKNKAKVLLKAQGVLFLDEVRRRK